MKKGIAIAILLGWIDSPHQQVTTAVDGSTSEASQVIGVARRMSSLGLNKTNTKEQVQQARDALTAAEEEMRANEDRVIAGLIEAQQQIAEAYESKAAEDNYEEQLQTAKDHWNWLGGKGTDGRRREGKLPTIATYDHRLKQPS